MGCVYGTGVQIVCCEYKVHMLDIVCMCVIYMQFACEDCVLCVHSVSGMWGGEEGSAHDCDSQLLALELGWREEGGVLYHCPCPRSEESGQGGPL